MRYYTAVFTVLSGASKLVFTCKDGALKKLRTCLSFCFFHVLSFLIYLSACLPAILLFSPHQKHSDGSPSEESRQDISPVVAVLSHSDHTD